MELSEVKKYEQLRFDQWVAFGNKAGGLENVKRVLSGDLEIEVKKAVSLLFDKYGRRIPKNLRANVCDANRDFRLEQPQLVQEADFASRILRLEGCLGVNTGITTEQFQQETGRLLMLIRDNSQISNIANGVWLPLILPKLITSDLGAQLEYYLAAVNNSYVKTFSQRKFYNLRQGDLSGKVSIVEGSRHNQLIERMKQSPIIGLCFPNPLQGFSVNASREQMTILPEKFVISGLDTVIAIIMYPDILARDYYTLGLDLSALSWGSSGCSFCFRADDDRLDFSGGGGLGGADGSYSSGLFLAEC